MQNYKVFSENNTKSNQYFPSSNSRAEDGGHSLRCPDDMRTPTVNNPQVLDDSVNKCTKFTAKVNESTNCMAGDIDDDDILEVIYYDLIIWMSQNQ